MAITLERWGVVMIRPPRVYRDRYAPPETFPRTPPQPAPGLAGLVDGNEVELLVNKVDSAAPGRFWSNGVEYQLGEPDPEFEKMFPNAKERALQQFEKLSA